MAGQVVDRKSLRLPLDVSGNQKLLLKNKVLKNKKHLVTTDSPGAWAGRGR